MSYLKTVNPVPFSAEVIHFSGCYILKSYLSKVAPLSSCHFAKCGALESGFLSLPSADGFLEYTEKLKLTA